jgi:hypothetical protein
MRNEELPQQQFFIPHSIKPQASGLPFMKLGINRRILPQTNFNQQ